MAQTAEDRYYVLKAGERQFENYAAFSNSIRRRLARAISDEAIAEWIKETEQWIRRGCPAIGAPPLRVKEVESGNVRIAKAGSIDLNHPIFCHPPDVLQGISLSAKIDGQELSDLPFVSERTFFGRSTDRTNNAFYTIAMLTVDDGEVEREAQRTVDYAQNTYRLSEVTRSNVEARYIIVNQPYITSVYYNYYTDFEGIKLNDTRSLGAHIVFSKYSQLYLHGVLACAYEEFRNHEEKMIQYAEFASHIRSFNKQDNAAKTGASKRRMTIAGYYR